MQEQTAVLVLDQDECVLVTDDDPKGQLRIRLRAGHDVGL